MSGKCAKNISAITDEDTRDAMTCVMNSLNAVNGRLDENLRLVSADIQQVRTDMSDLEERMMTSNRKYVSSASKAAKGAGFGSKKDYEIRKGNPYDVAKQLKEEAGKCCDPSKSDCTGKVVCLVKDDVDGTVKGSFDFSQAGLKGYGGSRAGLDTGARVEKYCPTDRYYRERFSSMGGAYRF